VNTLVLNDYTKRIKSLMSDSVKVKELVLQEGEVLTGLAELASLTVNALRQGKKVIFAGNGGSYADAQHLAGEFVSRFMFDRAPLAGLALGTNGSVISAVGNDYGYRDVFVREIAALGVPGDVFIPLSTSGNSANLLEAASWGVQQGLEVVGFTGKTGGKLAEICECVKVPSEVVPRIQECHITLGHILCELVEADIFLEVSDS
jgi:D-sedoheptulose 7-phosphate isomerase